MTARVVLGVSGASGAALALDCARALVATGAAFDLVLSPMAEQTLAQEIGPDARAGLEALATAVHPIGALGAAISSGSYPVAGMIVAPCSMRSLCAIAYGQLGDLLTRAADVQLKERRRLVLVARESPLHLGHLRAMAQVTEYGAIIAPPVPAFYLKPADIAAIVDQIALRALGLLNLEPESVAFREWQVGGA